MSLPWIIVFVIAGCIAIVVSTICVISLQRKSTEEKILKERIRRAFEQPEEPFEEFSDTASMALITGSGFTQNDYEEIDHLYLELVDAPLCELAEIISCEPEVLEKQLDTLNHVLHCIQFKWDNSEEVNDISDDYKKE